jgi:hypothetical protein
MEILAEQPIQTNFDRNKRDYDDITTMFAEMVNGRMRTSFEYHFDGQELYARDGSPMLPEFVNGLERADEIADELPNLAFEVRRRRSEIDEYHDMLKMARGQLPNTMVVVSDFPPELMDSTQNVGGYNTERKQAMLRVLTWDGQRLQMYSQSLDGSHRSALEAIYAGFGQTPQDGELLGQRIHADLPPVEQALIIDKLTCQYDRQMQSMFGGSWHAGRPETSGFNTYDFVREQHDIIQAAMVQQRLGQLDLVGLAATLDERFMANQYMQPEGIIIRYNTPFHDLNAEITQATARARLMGKVFSACGITVGGEGNNNLVDELAQAGYGNKASESSYYKFDKKMFCVVCQAPPKEKAAKKLCGPCGICKGCDSKLKRKA